MGLGRLGDPRGDRGGVHAVSDAGGYTADKELDETADVATAGLVTGSKGGDGDDGTDDHDDRAEEHDSATAHSLAGEEGEEGAEEAPDFVARRDGALDGTGVDVTGRALLGLDGVSGWSVGGRV